MARTVPGMCMIVCNRWLRWRQSGSERLGWAAVFACKTENRGLRARFWSDIETTSRECVGDPWSGVYTVVEVPGCHYEKIGRGVGLARKIQN
jgi:hypothetical protein